MVRHIVLGNQRLLVNIDQWLQVRDIYYPHVGQYNHLLGHAHRVAVLEGDRISWVNDDSWNRDIKYLDETLVTDSVAVNEGMGLALRFNENVYCEDDIFFRKITIENKADHARSIRLLVHHDFHLYGDGLGDTAYYSPEHKAVVHYKRSTYFIIGFCDGKDAVMDDYTVGEHINPGWHLGQRPIAQGEVDSMIAMDVVLPSGGSKVLTYYLAAGKELESACGSRSKFISDGVEAHLDHVSQCQKGFLARIEPDISGLDPRMQEMYKRSLLIIRTQFDHSGAIIAANDSDNVQFNKDTYSYMWPRDGALVAISLIKAGYSDLAKSFFMFCKDVLYKEGCLLHKYNPNKTLGSSWHPWIVDGKPSLPIQEDETALVLLALKEYYDHTKDKKFIKSLYAGLIKPMGDFLTRYRYENGLPKESYDLWEERRGVFTFTTSAVLAGLMAADKLGDLLKDKEFCETCNIGHDAIRKAMIEHLYHKEKGYFRRGVSFETGDVIYDDAMDASAYGIFAFGAFEADDAKVVSTMERMKEWLWVKTDIGGMARYYNDGYHQSTQDLASVPGNPWFICTLWYAKWVIQRAKNKEDLGEAKKILEWVVDHALSTGILAEQIHPYSGEPLSVSPLTWSHAEFVDTVTDYVDKLGLLH